MSRSVYVHTYDDIISVENLLLAWREFKRGKTQKKDVQEFEMGLMDNVLSLYRDLKEKTYTHGGYVAMNLPAAELSPHSATAPYRRGIVRAPHKIILKTEGFQTFLQGALWQRPQGI